MENSAKEPDCTVIHLWHVLTHGDTSVDYARAETEELAIDALAREYGYAGEMRFVEFLRLNPWIERIFGRVSAELLPPDEDE